MEQLLDRGLYLKIKSLYEANPRRFKGWRDMTSSGTNFSLTDKVTGEVFKGRHSVGYYVFDFNDELEIIQDWHGPFFCKPDEVKELYEIVSNRQESRRRKLLGIKISKLRANKLNDLKLTYAD